MKKADLVKAAAQGSGVSREKVSDVINSVFEAIAEELKNGGSYNQDNFGTFKTVKRAARKGRNPKTGETVAIPEKTTVKFVISGSLKKLVN